jgi:hypothetical protein
MKNYLFTVLAAATVAGFGPIATVNAAPAAPPTVDGTVSQLQSQGFEVIVYRVGDKASERCSVGSVRPGQTFSRTDSGAPGAGDDLVTTLISKTVYVELTC